MFNKKFFISLVVILFVGLLGFFAQRVYTDLVKGFDFKRAESISLVDERMNSLFLKMDNFPSSPANDLLFISNLSSLKGLTNISNGKSREEIVKQVERDFFEFFKDKTAYYQLRYIDRLGEEIVRIEFDGENHSITLRENLQDKFSRDYLFETVKLKKGEVYISPLELNIENGEIENKGTKENPEYVPVVRYSTPMINDKGENNGTLIFNVYANYFLDDIKEYQRENNKVFLINKEGGYFSHPDKTKEFSFALGEVDNFYTDYPEISKEMLADTSQTRLETDDLIFSFRRISLGLESFKDYNLNDLDKDDFWILVNVFEKGEIQKAYDDLVDVYQYFMVLLGIIALFFILIFLLVFKSPKKLPNE